MEIAQVQPPVSSLLELLEQHLKYLKTLREDLKDKTEYSQYPIRELIMFYEDTFIKKKLQMRANRKNVKKEHDREGSKLRDQVQSNAPQKMFINDELENHANLYIFSDILITVLPKLIVLIYQAYREVQRLPQKFRKEMAISVSEPPPPSIIKTTSLNATTSFMFTSQPQPTLKEQSSLREIIEEDEISHNFSSSFINVNTFENILDAPRDFVHKRLLGFVNNVVKMYSNFEQNERISKELQTLNSFIESYEKWIKVLIPELYPNFPTENEKHNEQIRNLSLEKLEEKIKESLFPPPTPDQFKLLRPYGFRFYFLTKLKQKVKKANKHIEERKQRFKEFIDGEKNYITVLKDYIEYVKKPIEEINKTKEYICEEDMRALFSTIESILTFHCELYACMNERFEKYEKYTKFSDILKIKFPYFKIYTEYLYYADRAELILLSLEKYEEIEEIFQKFMQDKQKKASNELKQPTFRIVKYKLLLDDILKNTNPIHSDYKPLLDANKSFKEILIQINADVGVRQNRDKANYLQKQYGTESKSIMNEKRELIEEFLDMYYIHEGREESVSVYIFNDCLIVIQGDKKIIKWINIDENFYVRKEEDNKTYKNVVKIHSDGYITFSAGKEPKNEKKAEMFYAVLSKQSKENEENNTMVYVQVLGTEEIGSTSFAKHTEYVIEIKYLGMRKTVHLRFSEMQPFVTKMQQEYGNDLNISKEEALKKNWFNNHKSKTIENRKRTIEQILQKMLNHESVKKRPIAILEELKLDGNFFKVTEEYKKRKNQEKSEIKAPLKEEESMSNSNLNISSLSQSPEKNKKKESKEAETILCATEIKLGKDIYHEPNEFVFSIETKKEGKYKVEVEIFTMVEEEPVKIFITEETKVEDVCHKVSKLIGLRMNRDFRLFHEIGKKELRALDPEQKLMKIFNFPRREVQNGFFSEIIGNVKKIVAPETHPKLIFKKYYFLPVDIEQSECRKDLTRLRLLVYQIFSEIKEMKYRLHFDEYLLFLAMLVYIEYEGEPPQKLSQFYVHRLIPETIFKLKNYTEEQWLEKCRSHLIRLREEIDKIIEHNREQLRNKRIKTESVSKTALHFGHKHLCSQIVINKIKGNMIYGSNLFYVQPYKHTYTRLSEQGMNMAYNMWLAIKVEGLHILTPSSKETVLELKYKDVEKMYVESESITFKMESLGTCQYRFNTYQSFEISQLVNYNKCLNETLEDLENNENLILKARMYKMESLIYRNTRNNDEKQKEE